MTKASLIREIMAHGYTGKSPNTLRRYSIETLQGILASLPALEQIPIDECVSYEMPSFDALATVPAIVAPIYVIPSDKELYALALAKNAPVRSDSRPDSNNRPASLASLLIAPFAFLARFAGF